MAAAAAEEYGKDTAAAAAAAAEEYGKDTAAAAAAEEYGRDRAAAAPLLKPKKGSVFPAKRKLVKTMIYKEISEYFKPNEALPDVKKSNEDEAKTQQSRTRSTVHTVSRSGIIVIR